MHFFPSFFFFSPATCFDFSAMISEPVHYSRIPQTSLFNNFLIKNGSHDTIHTFKNYIYYSVFSFQFQQNKLYPNGPYIINLDLNFYFSTYFSHYYTNVNGLFFKTKISTFIFIVFPNNIPSFFICSNYDVKGFKIRRNKMVGR